MFLFKALNINDSVKNAVTWIQNITIMLLHSRAFSCVIACRRFLKISSISRSDNSAVQVDEVIDMEYFFLKRKPHTVVCTNGVVACWHPEPKFPYEHTRPIDPAIWQSKNLVSGPIKQEFLRNYNTRRFKRGPPDFDLQNIFYSWKLDFLPRKHSDCKFWVAKPLVMVRFTSFISSFHVDAFWLGRISYADGINLQRKFVEKLQIQRACKGKSASFKGYLLLLEHNPVYTVGLREHFYSKEEENRLRQLGADFFRTNRGGLITFHGPGQLVAYPVMDLLALSINDDQKTSKVGVRRFVHLIEEVIIRTVRSFGLTGADRSSNTGVWLKGGSRKVAAIGINIHRGYTSHGLALNCNVDLQWFRHIVPCGLRDKEVTSLSKELNRNVEIGETIKPLCDQFSEIFQCSISYSSEDETFKNILARNANKLIPSICYLFIVLFTKCDFVDLFGKILSDTKDTQNLRHVNWFVYDG
ncbi:unnamed protein product [Dracunculus medinensis]|uniref:lipoyl(octanoyl) transferase n=1 Tax=Dracunculus medinensis TaxID=318479 RepID=A0A0N4U4D2_DRAME|nr:unnamed protein product [Dracunculus medinensis]